MKKKISKSYYPKPSTTKEYWFTYNAKDKVLGRAASDIASLVMGKYHSIFTPGVNPSIHVIVTNIAGIKVTGKKFTDKLYYSHSGYPGGLKTTSYRHLIDKKPTDALRRAIKGMLPKNSCGSLLINNILFYQHDNHKHEAQQPIEFKGI